MVALAIRPQDRPLRSDVRRLASALGRVIARLEGPACFDAVEELRQACLARRRGAPGAPALGALLARVDALPLAVAAKVARGFTLFFLLINTAEQVHRARRRRAHQRLDAPGPQPASLRWALRRLQAAGHSAAAISSLLARLEVRPVLTAHPTESTRRSVLAIQARVADLLLGRDACPDEELRLLDDRLEAEVELLWLTSEVRHDRPSVLDEASTALWYLENRLLPGVARLRQELASAAAEAGVAPPMCPVLRFGSWVGGDRDGNPHVTPEVTLAAARRAAHAVAGSYRAAIEALIGKLSLSERIKPIPDELRASLARDRDALPAVAAQLERRAPDELLRQKLGFMAARLDARRSTIAARDAGASVPLEGYASVEELQADLQLVRDALVAAGATRAAVADVDPLLNQVGALGLHGFEMDVREDARVHTAALDEIARAIGSAPLGADELRRELLGRRPLLGPRLALPESVARTLQVFDALGQVQREHGQGAARTYIVSMAESAEDLLRVLLLAQERGLVDLSAEPPWSRLDVVPLFETWEALGRAAPVMAALYADPVYRRQLAARGSVQEVMIGYSDSAKDAGVLPAAWALYRAQEGMARASAAAGVTLRLFHGQGGSVGRGGGSPVYRALSALPPDTMGGAIKITEQGEVISQKFGLAAITERSLEVMVSGALAAATDDWRRRVDDDELERFTTTIERAVGLAHAAYRRLVHDDHRLFRLLTEVTPLAELAHVHYGSRPAFRAGRGQEVAAIRAIPWVFGWTQIRLLLPGWLGVGTALDALLAEPDGLPTLRRMAAAWPFFDDLLGKVELACAKADLDVARAYVEHLDGDRALFDELTAELERTVRALRAIRGAELLAGSPQLRATIAQRNPYVDPLSLVQISLLRRKRELAAGDPRRELLDQALGTTLNGVAQGMRNTG
jgi:phosphoenolpyruvate carboxylase